MSTAVLALNASAPGRPRRFYYSPNGSSHWDAAPMRPTNGSWDSSPYRVVLIAGLSLVGSVVALLLIAYCLRGWQNVVRMRHAQQRILERRRQRRRVSLVVSNGLSRREWRRRAVMDGSGPPAEVRPSQRKILVTVQEPGGEIGLGIQEDVKAPPSEAFPVAISDDLGSPSSASSSDESSAEETTAAVDAEAPQLPARDDRGSCEAGTAVVARGTST